MSFFTSSTIFELICLFASFAWLRKTDGRWFYFRHYMALIVLCELAGWYIRKYTHSSNIPLYNGLIIVLVLFSIWQLCGFGQLAYSKRTTNILLLSLFTVSLMNLLFVQGIRHYNNWSLMLGSFSIIMLCLLYNFNLVKGAVVPERTFTPELLIVTGWFLFHSGLCILLFFNDTLERIYHESGMHLSRYILDAINVLNYGCMSLAFFLQYRRNIQRTKRSTDDAIFIAVHDRE